MGKGDEKEKEVDMRGAKSSPLSDATYMQLVLEVH